MAKQGLRDFTRTIGAGEERTINVEGDYYHVVSASSDVMLSFDDGAYITRSKGMGGNVEPYKIMKIKSIAAQTVVVALGSGSLSDSRATFGGVLNVTVEPSNLNTPLAEISIGAGATVLLAAADATRKELRVGVRSNQPDGVYVGDIATGAVTQGGFIEAGSVDYISSEAAIYAYNDGSLPVIVNLLDLKRV